MQLSSFVRWQLLGLTLVLLATLAGTFLISKSKSKDFNTIRVAYPGTVGSMLLLVADRQGYFAEQDVVVQIDKVVTGREAIELLASGKTDFAVSYGVPVINSYYRGAKIKILSQLFSAANFTAVLYRQDRGIRSPMDLKHHKTGTIKGTTSEFVTELILKENGIAQPNLIEVPLDQAEEALMTGKVDALALWEPLISQIHSRNHHLLARINGESYTQFMVLSASEATLAHKRRQAEALLLALNQAKLWMAENPKEARQIIENSLDIKVDPQVLALWDRSNVQLGLGKDLLGMLNLELKWFAQKEKLPMPESGARDLIDSSVLSNALPDTVSYQ